MDLFRCLKYSIGNIRHLLCEIPYYTLLDICHTPFLLHFRVKLCKNTVRYVKSVFPANPLNMLKIRCSIQVEWGTLVDIVSIKSHILFDLKNTEL